MKIAIRRLYLQGLSVLSLNVVCRMSPALRVLVKRDYQPGCNFSIVCQFLYASVLMAPVSLPACMLFIFSSLGLSGHHFSVYVTLGRFCQGFSGKTFKPSQLLNHFLVPSQLCPRIFFSIVVNL